MLFSVIYSFDIERGNSVQPYNPPRHQRWDLTEGDDQGEGAGYKHRKWCALLTRPQFDKFVRHCELMAESTETMGSLGSPGFVGWSPAISFRLIRGYYVDEPLFCGAYVSPLPEVDRPNGFTERDWERIRRAVISIYG